jgi:hypothetical protein
MRKQPIASRIEDPPPNTCLIVERGYKPGHDFVTEYGQADGLYFLVKRLFKQSPLVIVIRTPDGVLDSISIDDVTVLIKSIRLAFEVIKARGYGNLRSRWIVSCSQPTRLIAMAELQYDAFRFLGAVA